MANSKKDLLQHTEDFEIRMLSQETDVSGFRAAEGDIYTTFLTRNAKKSDKEKITSTYLIYHKESPNTICGYFSLMFDVVQLKRDTKPLNIPACIPTAGAIQIYQLAGSLDFTEEYCHIVRFILGAVKATAITISRYVNIRYITLYADTEDGNKNNKEIYQNAGFKVFDITPTFSGFAPETTFMFLDIYEEQPAR